MIELIKYLNSFQKLDEVTEEAIRQHFVEETFKRNDFIVKNGAVCSKVYFIESGLVRRFYVEDDREITRWIYDNHHMMTLMNSYFL